MGQECFYRENRQDRAEEEILLTERLAEGCGETHWRIRPMTQRENEEIWKRCGEDEGRYQEMILAESVVFPDLKDGEYDCLRREVERINGGEDDGCTDYI